MGLRAKAPIPVAALTNPTEMARRRSAYRFEASLSRVLDVAARRYDWFSGEPEAPFQPASRLARRHGADHGGGAAIPPVLDFRDVQIEPGGTPATVRMAKLQNSAPHRSGKVGMLRKAGAPKRFERVG